MPLNNHHKVTIKDVGEEAGVSYSTVSRVINNIGNVVPEKRERVLAAIEKLGYVVNQQARSLAGGRTNVIGLIVQDVMTGYTGPIVRGIDEALHAADYDLILYTTHHRRKNEIMYAHQFANGLTEGLLLLLPMASDAYLATLCKQRFPYVVIDDYGFDDFSTTITATNWQGAHDGVSYLIRLGHRRIAHLKGVETLRSSQERFEAYRQALREAGIGYDDSLVLPGMFTRKQGYLSTLQLLDLPEPPTAIFAANDMSAYGALDAIRTRGMRVPHDISLLGFDDDNDAALMYPALTTIRQPLAEMGRKATELLLRRINYPEQPAQQIKLATELVERATCAPPKAQ